MPFSLHGGIQWHTSASHALLCQMPFHQAVPLLSICQQNLTEYWWKGSTSTAIPSISTCNVMGQHKKNRTHYFGNGLCIKALTKWHTINYSLKPQEAQISIPYFPITPQMTQGWQKEGKQQLTDLVFGVIGCSKSIQHKDDGRANTLDRHSPVLQKQWCFLLETLSFHHVHSLIY